MRVCPALPRHLRALTPLALTRRAGKQKFENIELDVSQPVELLKAQLFALTSVPPERQKIMGLKGGPLKDDADLSTLGVKVGQNLMLMGSAEAVPEAPKEAIVFAEDMPAKDVAALHTSNPGGLTNLGNTCYLNSTLQCMKAIPEFSRSLSQFSVGGEADPFVPAMRSLVAQLERSNAANEIQPIAFVTLFRKAFPQFAEQTEQGHWMQQDAEECWTALINNLSGKLTLATDGSPTNLGANADQPLLPRMQTLKRNLGDMLFGIELESTSKCLDSEAEPPSTTREALRKIGCHISDKTAHLYTALEVNLDEVIEKNSPVLGVEARYAKKSKLARLPPCLTVQFVRFAYRKDTNKRAKILRTVSFPPMLDVRNLCTPELQKSINAHCSILEKERDIASGAASSSKAEAPTPAAGLPPAPPAAEAAPAAAGSSSGAEAMETDTEPPQTAEEIAALAEGAAGAECGDNRTGRCAQEC